MLVGRSLVFGMDRSLVCTRWIRHRSVSGMVGHWCEWDWHVNGVSGMVGHWCEWDGMSLVCLEW